MAPERHSNIRQFMAASSACLLSLCAGTALGWSSPAVPLLLEDGLSHEEASMVGSLLTIGAFIGCFPAGGITDRIGRKRTLLIFSVPMSVSWCLLMFYNYIWSLYIGRFLSGLAIGVLSVATPTYINEISTTDYRGTLGTLYQLQIIIGITIVYFFGLLEELFTITLICSLFGFLFVITFIWVPESPDWLLNKGMRNEARQSLQWLRGPKCNIESEMSEKLDSASQSEKDKGGLISIFKTPESRKAFSFVFWLMFFQQFSGINAIVFYANSIIADSGSSITASTGSIMFGIISVLSTGAAAALMELAGRRVLLAISSATMCLSLLGLGGFVLLSPGLEFGWVPLLCLAVYSVAFAVGLGPVPWIMMIELFPASLKASASTLGAATSWGLAFLITRYVLAAVDYLSLGVVLWIFAFFCLLAVVFTCCFLTETKGKTTDEILIALGTIKDIPSHNPSPVDDVAI